MKKSKQQQEKELELLASAMKLREQELDWATIAKEIGMTVRGLQQMRKRYNVNSFSELLEHQGFQGSSWSHGWLKSDDASIFVRNEIDQKEEMLKLKDEIIEEMKKYSPKFKKIKRDKISEPHLLVLSLADVHIGKYSSDSETGEKYNVNIAVKRCLEGVKEILIKSYPFNIDKILLVLGNDILHIDQPHRKTTAGTPQDTDGMWYEAFIRARRVCEEVIEMLLPVADIEVVFNPSNHDFMSGFMLLDSVYCLFRNHPNISFDIDMKHRKYFKYGESLICTTHGDGAKPNDLPLIMASESPMYWSITTNRYVYIHHVHHFSGKEIKGVSVESLRAISGTDGWHHRKGYIAKSAIDAFIHSEENGQVAKITHLFK